MTTPIQQYHQNRNQTKPTNEQQNPAKSNPTHTNPTISPKSEPNKTHKWTTKPSKIKPNPHQSSNITEIGTKLKPSKLEPNRNQNQAYATTPPSQNPHHYASIIGPTKLCPQWNATTSPRHIDRRSRNQKPPHHRWTHDPRQINTTTIRERCEREAWNVKKERGREMRDWWRERKRFFFFLYKIEFLL